MNESIPSSAQPAQEAQKPRIWFELRRTGPVVGEEAAVVVTTGVDCMAKRGAAGGFVAEVGVDSRSDCRRQYILRVNLRSGTRLSADRQTSRGCVMSDLEGPTP